jgi:hypothetical protein
VQKREHRHFRAQLRGPEFERHSPGRVKSRTALELRRSGAASCLQVVETSTRKYIDLDRRGLDGRFSLELQCRLKFRNCVN